MAKTITQEFIKGLWAEVPPFRLVLGLCPVLAVTKTMENGIGMGRPGYVLPWAPFNPARAWLVVKVLAIRCISATGIDSR